MNGWRKDIPKLLGNISPDALMRMKLDEQMLLVEGVVQVDADDGWAMPFEGLVTRCRSTAR